MISALREVSQAAVASSSIELLESVDIVSEMKRVAERIASIREQICPRTSYATSGFKLFYHHYPHRLSSIHSTAQHSTGLTVYYLSTSCYQQVYRLKEQVRFQLDKILIAIDDVVTVKHPYDTTLELYTSKPSVS